MHATLFPTAGEQCWFYHSSGNRGNSSPGRHFYCLLCFLCSSKVSSLAHISCDLWSVSSTHPRNQKLKFSTTLRGTLCSTALTGWGPAVLMVLSSRWLFPYPEGMRQPRRASQNSLTINLTRWQTFYLSHWRRYFSPFYWSLTEVYDLYKARVCFN